MNPSPILRRAAAIVAFLANTPAPTRQAALARALNTAPRLLEPLLQRLTHLNILESHRGPAGGYTLHRDRITLAELVDALDPIEETGIPGMDEAIAVAYSKYSDVCLTC